MFGTEDPDEAVSPDTEDPENISNSEADKTNETQKVSTRKWAEETNYEASKLFKKVKYF